MKNLKNKLNKKGGFTLVEMLIVVAIIAILIAVSIPLVNNALDRAKHATDAANERAAKAEILICWLSEDASLSGGGTVTADTVYFYDAVNGTLKTSGTGITPYGKHKAGADAAAIDHTDKVIIIKVNSDGQVYTGWEKPSVTNPSLTANTGLCSDKDVSH